MKRDFYYYEKRSPLKGIIIAVIAAGVLGGGYWYYVNYFKTAGSEPAVRETSGEEEATGNRVEALTGTAYVVRDDEQVRLMAGDVVSSDALITTEPSARLAMAVGDARIRLDGNTRVQLSDEGIEIQSGRLYTVAAPGHTYRILALATAIDIPAVDISA